MRLPQHTKNIWRQAVWNILDESFETLVLKKQVNDFTFPMDISSKKEKYFMHFDDPRNTAECNPFKPGLDILTFQGKLVKSI